MPSESQLIEEYKVSRVTLRQALAELEKDNLIKRYRGKGAFITAISPKPFVHDLSYKLVNNDKLLSNGSKITAKTIKLCKLSPAYPEIKEALNLPDDKDEVVFLKRLFLLDGKPIAIGKSWLPSYLLPGITEKGLLNDSLSDTLEKNYNFITQKVDDYIEVIRASQSESIVFDCPLDVPILLITSKSFVQNGIPMEYGQTSWLGDAVKFHFAYTNHGKGLELGN